MLARMHTIEALAKMQVGLRRDPLAVLLVAIEEVICETRERISTLESSGKLGTSEHLKLIAQTARWEEARKLNR